MDNGFGVASKFSIADIESKVLVDPLLKNKISSMKYEGKNHDRIEKMINDMKRYGIVELVDEVTNTFKVLDSYDYLQQLIMRIHVPDVVEEG